MALKYSKSGYENADLITEARVRYANNGHSDDIEIDDDAKVSRGDAGVWVQTWVWVPFPDSLEE